MKTMMTWTIVCLGLILNCDYANAGQEASVSHDQKKIAREISALQKKLRKNPADARLRVRLGMILLQNEKFDQALAQFDSALTSQPDLPAAKFGRAEVNFLQGHRDEALNGYLEVFNSPEAGQYAKAIAERIGAPYAVRPITTAPGEHMMARFSADGRAIVFQSNRNGNWEIYRAYADGSQPVRLTNDPAVDESPSFSPDGKWIVFVRSQEKAAREIYMMEALFGTDLICISRHRADDWNPIFSPKGDRLAFVSDRDDLRPVELHERQSDIFLFSLADSSLTRFSQGFGAKAAPCFTPDGESLVYVNNVNGMFDIFEQRLGTTSPVSLIAKAGPKGGPQVSPNRKHIVYFEKLDNNLDLFLFDRDKSSVQRLTCNPGVDAFPTFSPDGNEIYFSSNRGGNYQIYALDLRTPISRAELAETLRRLLEPLKTAAQ
jgi:TolB protein